jgi:methylenetetrahydrofolate reductase (NADPH)
MNIITPFIRNSYIIELLTPSQASKDIDKALENFREKYLKILASGSVVSIPDNPLGTPRFTASEVLSYLDLPVEPEQLLIHVNSFHRLADLDESLNAWGELGVKYLLCVSGDGSSRLPKLEPFELGSDAKTVTAVELLRYISARTPSFHLGAAYNQYEPHQDENEKLEKKITAGAGFLITQPVIAGLAGLAGQDSLAPIASAGLPIFKGAWMSDNVDLLTRCLGGPEQALPGAYNGGRNLRLLHAQYPHQGLYLSLLSFAQDWNSLLPNLKRAPSALS